VTATETTETLIYLTSNQRRKPGWARLLLPEVHVLCAEGILESLVVWMLGWRTRHNVVALRREETPEKRLVRIITVMIRGARPSLVRELYDSANDASIHSLTLSNSGSRTE